MQNKYICENTTRTKYLQTIIFFYLTFSRFSYYLFSMALDRQIDRLIDIQIDKQIKRHLDIFEYYCLNKKAMRNRRYNYELYLHTFIVSYTRGTYIRWQLRNYRCALKEQSLSFDLYKSFDQFESKHNFFLSEKTYFPSCVRTVF